MTGLAHTARPLIRRLAMLRSGTAMPAALAFAGLACAALPAAAQAQGFNGTVTSSSGVSINAANTDVTVLGQEAIINWNATGATAGDTNVDFLPAGATVLFHDNAGGNFTVLNRITPTYTDIATGATSNLAATISLSGTVNSTVSVPNGAGGFNNVQGGNVWFYSPYGIIANGTSAFNVGSLLLTTSDIDTSNAGSLYLASPSGQKIGFLQASQPGSSVKILPGAQINAAGDPTLPNSAYVGVFAPRIEQGGTISSDGMTALVAGEAGTITFNLGLIDVAVTTGTTDGNGIVHTGTTTGPASSGETQTIALVAMPQNTALTMLLSGSIGYTPAAIGTPDGSAVVLTAGYDPALPAATLAAGLGNIAISNGTFSNQLTGRATGSIDVSSVAAGLTDFQGYTEFDAGKAITLTANAGQEIRGSGGLILNSLLPLVGIDVALTVTGATATIPTDGLIDIPAIYIHSGGTPDYNAPIPAIGTNTVGGTINLSVSKGTLSASSGITLVAGAVGQDGTDQGGLATGGTITVNVDNQGTISTPGFSASAYGSGGSANGSTANPTFGVGGDGRGGTITVSDGNTANGFGTLSFTDVQLTADGRGGSGASTSGSGLGGKIAVTIGNTENWHTLSANATASNGYPGISTLDYGSAIGQADAITVAVSGAGGNFTLGAGGFYPGGAYLDASAYISAGSSSAHSGRGGDIAVTASNGGVLTVIGSLSASSDARQTESLAFALPVAPSMTGGNVSIIADTNGKITVGTLGATAVAFGFGAESTGALAKGGNVTLGAQNGGMISFTDANSNVLSAEAYGAVGPVAGDAQGGTALVYASDGSITGAAGATLVVSASAMSGGANYQGSLVGAGFNATGGTASVELRSGAAGTGSIAFDTIHVRAKGDATVEYSPDTINDPVGFTVDVIRPIEGDGGGGKGNLAQVVVNAGTLTVNTLTIAANGIGGSSDFNTLSASPFVSGNGTGGTAVLSQNGGTINIASADVRAVGIGGGYDAIGPVGGVLPQAGNGIGGTARVALSGGTMTIASDLQIVADTIGGAGSGTLDGALNGGNGGNADASASLAELLMPAGSNASLIAPTITVRANALGGRGGSNLSGVATATSGNGGNAFGGTARYNLADGAIAVAGQVSALADASGGAGDTGGNATAGTAGFLLVDTVAAPATTRSLGTLLLSATPTGGAGSITGGTTTAGNTLFTARTGTLASALTITGDFTAIAPGTTAPPGDGFTGDFGAFPVTITGNALISTTRDVTAVASGGGANIGGTLTIDGRTVTTSGGGELFAAGNVSVGATAAINMAGVSSGGTTLLVAQDPLTGNFGPVHVGDLNSVGLVTVHSSAFDAGSTGALSFADSFATTGDFTVLTAGDLTVASISAGGNVSLTSIGGNFVNTGTVSGNAVTLGAGGNVGINGSLIVPGLLTVTAGGMVTTAVSLFAGSVDITGAGGITIASLSSLGTTSLQAPGGAILIGDLASVGAVTIAGQSAQVASSGALAVASATTTAGDLSLQAVDGLTLIDASAAGNLTLGSSAGAVLATGVVSVTGNTAISGATGITLSVLTSGGTTDLQGGIGAVAVTDLASVGAVTVGDPLVAAVSISGGAIALTSSAGSIHQLGQMTGISETFSAGANIVVDGAIAATGPGAAGNFTATAGGTFTEGAAGSITVTNNLSITAAGGITATALTGPGTANLQASGGAISVSNLSFVGGVSLAGQSATITAPGALLVNSATTTGGPLSLNAGGNLTISSANSAGNLLLAATGSVTGNGPIAAVGNVSLSAGTLASLGQLTSGGTTGLTVSNGSLLITDLNSAGPVTASANDITIGSTGALNFASATTTAGPLGVTTAGNLSFSAINAAGAVALTSTGGNVIAPAITATGPVSVSAKGLTIGSPGTLSFGTIVATTGAASITTVGDLTIGSASAGGLLTLTSTGGFVRNTGVLTGTGITLNALTDVLVDGALNDAAGPLTVAAGGSFIATTPLIQASGIAITAPLGIIAPVLNSSGGTLLTATGGAIGGPGGTALVLNSGSPVDLLGQTIAVTSANALAINSAQATAGALALDSTGGTLSVGSASAAGNLTLAAGGGNLLLTSGSAGGATSLSAPLGTISAGLTSVGVVDATARTVTITSPGLLQFGLANATAGDFSATAATGLAFGSVSATGAFNASTGGLFSLAGTAAAGTITVNSADILIGLQAQLGVRGLTSDIALRNSGSAMTFIGDAATGPGWRLDNGEVQRLFADRSIQIAVSSPTNGGPVADVVIGSLSLSYGPASTAALSSNLGNGGSFAVVTPGRIVVTGAVAATTSAANDLFSLSAGTIDLIGDTGSIALLDANGGLSGSLNLSAGTIRAETAAAFADTAAGGSLDVISARLDQNDGVVKPGGYFQADSITLSVTSALFIQNTGQSFALNTAQDTVLYAGLNTGLSIGLNTGGSTQMSDRRGFMANSLNIATSSAATAIAINGVLLDPNGALITGLDTQRSVLVNGVPAAMAFGSFAPLSTINGCFIGIGCTVPGVVIAPSGPIIEILPKPPVSGGPDPMLNLPVIQFGSPPLLDSPPLIDEPVTGVGNDDLWQRQCGGDTDCHG